MYGLNEKEMKILGSLNTPQKIQDFLNKLKINFDYHKDTFMSPREVLRTGKCHCIEGAVLAALILRLHGYKPLVVDLTTTKDDYDHVITVFKQYGKWGAITKTNHGVLRYREPVYRDIRELVMSYFHEYFKNSTRQKTLRSYSMPVNLARFDKKNWVTDEKDLWYIDDYLGKVKHIQIMNKKQIANLRKADRIEVKLGEITEQKSNYSKPKKKK